MFRSLRFVKPGWWMLLPPQGSPSAFVDADRLSEDERHYVDLDSGYDSRDAAKWDAAYLGFYRGLTATPGNALELTGEASAADEYRFLRKYFSRWWGICVLVMRCLQLRNPLSELRGFLRARPVRRVDLWARTFPLPDPQNTAAGPRVAVVIPTLNRYEYLEDALRDLQQQTYRDFEVIVIDQSQPYREEFYEQFRLDLRLIRQEQPGLWKARNSAVRDSKAGAILLFDDDSRVDPDWIARHLDCIARYDADISSGVSLSTVGDRIPESYRNYRQADQLDTGNALVLRHVFERVGLFDEQFEGQRMGDSEFGLRAFLAGFKDRVQSGRQARPPQSGIWRPPSDGKLGCLSTQELAGSQAGAECPLSFQKVFWEY